MKNILVTGGAGFIGCHLCRRLVKSGWKVTVLDNLSPQIHGAKPVPDLPDEVRLIVGDIRDRDAVATAVEGQDVIVHLAAETGTGQSMYEITRYEQVNIHGTVVLMDEISRQRAGSIRKVVLASSRAVYGEGSYSCPQHGTVFPKARRTEDMALGTFEIRCPICNHFCESMPTDENCPFSPGSFYGITKQVQEQTVLLIARTLGVAAYGLRYQNVYGPGQSLNNPYTGILAVFTNLAREGRPINVFEDGKETRDFVYIDDVVDATFKCVERPGEHVEVYNVGSGDRITVNKVATEVVEQCRSNSRIHVSGDFRIGDIRHNFADLTHINRHLGYEPAWSFERGVREFTKWALARSATESRFDASLEELKSRGLLIGSSMKS
jgi:dTDP-L-rhamnose 4-epimerase